MPLELFISYDKCLNLTSSYAELYGLGRTLKVFTAIKNNYVLFENYFYKW